MRTLISLLFLLVVHPLVASEQSEGIISKLEHSGWNEKVGANLGVLVLVKEQKLMLIRDYKVLFSTPCSTAAKGTGSRKNSFQTPLGWHIVKEKYGDGMPWGAVFESRVFTGKVWSKGQEIDKDPILTRILRLEGTEPGINKGSEVDSFERYIYIHGTSEEEKLGSPASHGCIRLSNNAVIQLFTLVPLNTEVLITE